MTVAVGLTAQPVIALTHGRRRLQFRGREGNPMSEEQNVQPPSAGDAAGGIAAEERQWAMFAHLSALAGGLVTAGWAFSIGCFLGPLVIWLMKRETMPFVDDQAKEALNFNITVAAIMLVLFLVGVLTLGIGFLVAVPLMALIGLAALVFIIIAAIKSNDGTAYRYPFAIRLIKWRRRTGPDVARPRPDPRVSACGAPTRPSVGLRSRPRAHDRGTPDGFRSGGAPMHDAAS